MEIKKYRLPYSDNDISFVQDHIAKILKKGYLTDGGDYVNKVEQMWANYIGTDTSIAVNSCTTALELILKAMNIENHSVIVPNYTFYASPLSVLNAGGNVIYSDINPRSSASLISVSHVNGATECKYFLYSSFSL